jgi:superfamily II DNA or RNA helicase
VYPGDEIVFNTGNFPIDLLKLDNPGYIKYNKAMTQGHSVLSLKFERGTLLLETLHSELIKKISKDIPVTYDARVSAWRCDALYYTVIRQQLLQTGCGFEDNVSKWREVKWPNPALPPLRTEQIEAVKQWMPTKSGVIVMPTGTGKTEIALAVMQKLAVSTLVVAPVRDLMYQWHRRILRGLGYDPGIIGDNTYMVRPVSVITYDSACIHMEKLGRIFNLIIFDECHHLPGEMRREAALMCTAPFRMGLTATPERSDSLEKDLDWLIGPTVYHLPISSVKGNTLADYEIIRIPIHLSPEEQEVYNTCSRSVRDYMARKNRDVPAGVFQWQDLMAETGKDPEARAVQKAYYKMKSIQDRAQEKLRVLEDLFRLHLGERIIIFTGSNIMAREISCRFLVPCLLNHCQKKERIDILEGFRDGIYPALVANQVLDEGVDIPAAKVAVVVGGSGSTRQAKQRLGRILRKSGGKQGFLYEIVCEDTSEVQRSRQRRSSDAYEGTRHRRL